MAKPCAVEGCPKPAGVPGTARGLCSTHYQRLMKHGSLMLPPRPQPVRERECEFPGCTKRQRGRGCCFTHWKRLHVHGDVHTVKRNPGWTAREDAVLLDLPRYPRSGMVRRGYLEDVARVLGRTDAAARSRLHVLRKREGKVPAR